LIYVIGAGVFANLDDEKAVQKKAFRYISLEHRNKEKCSLEMQMLCYAEQYPRNYLNPRIRRAAARRRVTGCLTAGLLALSTIALADDITYGYDALGHLTSVSVAGATAYYDYDAAGNITGIRRQTVVSSTPSVDTVTSSHPVGADTLAATPASRR
jgi:YD repeat-containing protein